MGAVPGMPGLLTTSSALRIFSGVCPPCSKGMSHFCSVARYSSLIFPLSDRKTSNPLTFASTAAPTPLSAPPKTTILAISFYYLTLSNANVLTARMIPMIQKRVTMRGSGMPFFW